MPFKRDSDGKRPAQKRDSGTKSSGGFKNRDERPFSEGRKAGTKPVRSHSARSDEARADPKGSFRDGAREDAQDRPQKRSYAPKDSTSRPFGKERPHGKDRPSPRFDDRRSGSDHPERPSSFSKDRPEQGSGTGQKRSYKTRSEDRPYAPGHRNDDARRTPYDQKPAGKTRIHKREEQPEQTAMTLNKYLAHSGISSRREAAILIKDGKVSVNGSVLTTPGYRVQPRDIVTLEGRTMRPQKDHVYVLLNKPRGFLTTTEDDRGRDTVMNLVRGATEGRLYPIGRLDRDTTGVLLLTNDGDLTQKLSHPKYEARKIYHVTLDKDVTKKDFDKIAAGVQLDDGPAPVDAIAYLEHKNEIGLELHNGRNRIVRRIFESLGYDVEKLDRVLYAGLTKKNVSRGKWRFLTEKEVVLLKHFKE